MALDLNTVKKNYKRNADFYKLDLRDEKKASTTTPWQDFEREEDLVDRIKSRESVTKRIERKAFKKSERPKQEIQSEEMQVAAKSIKKNSVYTDKMLNSKISERAKEIFGSINL